MRQIAYLKSLLNSEPLKAVELFDAIVGEESESIIQEACHALSNYIRHSSVYKRRLIFSKLQECSMLSRLYLSFQFHSFKDTMFPRKLIFEGYSVAVETRSKEIHHRHHVTAIGSNRFFNLGLLSDGSPVPEPRLVAVPNVVIRIEMTNTHTIFLTDKNQLFGCGKATSFLPNRTEDADGGYVALPTLIEIPTVGKHEKVTEMKVYEGGSRFVIGKKLYFIGKRPPLAAESNETVKISSNCHVLTSEKIPPHLVFPPIYQEVSVLVDGSNVQIYLTIHENVLHWDRTSNFSAEKPVSFIINGFPQEAYFDSFQVLSDATIYAVRNGLYKGKLDLWKNKDDGFIVKNGTILEHFDTKYTLIALMEEIPGSAGTEFFRVSPDGQNLIMKMGYQSHQNDLESEKFEFKSQKTHVILENRLEQCDPVDIPMDLKIYFHENFNQNNRKYETNRLLFEWMYPEYAIGNDECVHFSVEQSDTAFAVDLNRRARCPTAADPSSEFVPRNTDPSLIWHIITTEKVKIPCHSYLFLLHSRQISAMQRFQTNYGRFSGHEQGNDSDAVGIETNATAETVRNALRGMLDLRILFEIKTIELIECINFYDYHLMDEMFNDAMHILMETITEFTLPFLYELFYSFSEKVLEGLQQRPCLLFNSISAALPPKELLVQFAENLETTNRGSSFKTKKGRNFQNLENLATYETDYVVKYFLNIDEDSEEVVWRSLRQELSDTLNIWYAEAVKRRDEKRTVRSRNNSQTYKPESSTRISTDLSTTTPPIPIGGRQKSESLSKSISSPVQSPLAYSLSPITKALPILKSRKDSISNSLEDFPEMGTPSTTCNPKSSSGRFAPKGARFKKDFEILKPSSPQNPWKVSSSGCGASSSILEENVKEVKFDEIIRKEEKLQRNIKTGFKKVQLLPHVETEELAGMQILEVFRKEFQDEALIRVELVTALDFDAENEQTVWGNMPGLVRR